MLSNEVGDEVLVVMGALFEGRCVSVVVADVETGTEKVPVVNDVGVDVAALDNGNSFLTSRSGSFMSAVMRA